MRGKRQEECHPHVNMLILCRLGLAQRAKTLQSVGHDGQLSFLFEAVVQRRLESIEGQIALLLKGFLRELLLLGLEVGGVWLLLFCHAVNQPILPEAQGRPDVARI